MRNAQSASCPQHVSALKLSAWRDGDLSAVETAELREHIDTCSACRATIADYGAIGSALQRELPGARHESSRRQDRLWRDLRGRIVLAQGGQHMHISKALIWRGLGALAIIAILIVFSVELFQSHLSHLATTSHHTPTGVISATTSPVPLDPMITKLPTAAQAWGAHAAQYTISLAGTPGFVPYDIAPDGSFIAGYIRQSATSTTFPIETITTSTSKTQQLATTTIDFTRVHFGTLIRTDGRYIAWIKDGNPEQIVALDTQNGQTSIVAESQPADSYLDLLQIDQGRGLWLKRSANQINTSTLLITDLATNTTTTLLQIQRLESMQVDWPFAFYTADVHTGNGFELTSYLRNLVTGTTIMPPDGGETILSDTTMFSLNMSATPEELDELPLADQAGASWQKLATLPWKNMPNTSTALALANNRIAAFLIYTGTNRKPVALLVWDLAQHRFIDVDLDISKYASYGKWLMTVSSTLPHVLRVYDTSQLPTSPPA